MPFQTLKNINQPITNWSNLTNIQKILRMSLFIKIKPLILVGCSGSGRSALMFHLRRNAPHKFERLISHTTRKPRQGEKDGEHFYFVDENWVQKNKQSFVTLTFSGNNNYYGLTRDEIGRVLNQNKIPVFKMTLDAYAKNVAINGKILLDNPITDSEHQEHIKQQRQKLIGKQTEKNQRSSSLHLTNDKKIACHALYIRVPSFVELERRLEFSPFSQYERLQKMDKARQEHNNASKYFEQEDIIGKQATGNEKEEVEFEETVIGVQSRLFELY